MIKNNKMLYLFQYLLHIYKDATSKIHFKNVFIPIAFFCYTLLFKSVTASIQNVNTWPRLSLYLNKSVLLDFLHFAIWTNGFVTNFDSAQYILASAESNPVVNC